MDTSLPDVDWLGPHAFVKADGDIWVVAGGGAAHHVTKEQWALWKALGYTAKTIDAKLLEGFRS